jgi:phosphoribosylformylglycinamidine synthase
LLRNANQQFVSKNIFIKSDKEHSKPLKVPIAHGEGRYFADEKLLDELESNGQVIYRYCDEAGEINDVSNPNGSFRGIAGIRNAQGNVFGMMPHPERACSALIGNTDGKKIIECLFIHPTAVQTKSEPVLSNF